MTHKERVRSLLASGHVDRVCVFDRDIEICSVDLTGGAERFLLLSFNGPFQDMADKLGLEEALVRFVREPAHSMSSFKDNLDKMIRGYRDSLDRGLRFDGIWIWEDVAYDQGLYFSVEKYKRQLMGLHKDIVDYFKSEGLPCFFHCDGNVEELIPILADMNIAAVHPMQERSNPSLMRMIGDFGRRLTFIGGVGIDRLNRSRAELIDHVKMLGNAGNYIFCFDGPVTEGADRKIYEEIIRDTENIEVYA